MITIKLDTVSKRYTNHWIIRNANYSFDKPIVYGISGFNGSGKSTLIHLLSGYLSPSVGQIVYSNDNGGAIDRNDIYKHLSIAAPYIDIEEVFTLRKFLTFYGKFRSWQDTLGIEDILKRSGLVKHSEVEVENFSSGMKQRVKLVTAMSTLSSLVLLDEPTSYLDAEAKLWLYQMIRERPQGQMLIMASNEKSDLDQCDIVLPIEHFQNKKESNLL